MHLKQWRPALSASKRRRILWPASQDHTPMGNVGSTSTSSPKTVTGRHELKVEGYSSTKGLPSGTPIRSSPFNIGGHTWYIGYFPGGIDSHSNEYVGVQLNLHDPIASGEVLARFRFVIQNHAGEIWSPSSQTDNIYTFSRKTPSHGCPYFIERTQLESLYVKDDCFKIQCDVTLIKDIHAVQSEFAVLPMSDLGDHLGHLLDSQVGGDITFQVDGKLFTAHRCVLAARSSVFMAQLFGPMKEKTASHVRIDDMDSRVFEALLHYIYTDMLMLKDMEEDETMAMFQHMLVAADRYNIARLKLLCEHILCNQINTDIVVSTLVLAEQHGFCGLKNACFEFLLSPGNLKTVMASDSFQHLKDSCPSLLDELLAKLAP